MKQLAFDLDGARVLTGGGLHPGQLSFCDGEIVADPVGRRVDLSGFLVLPGIVDLHGDGFERHLAPRRGAMKQLNEGVIATEAELGANGITTAVMAQFASWEGGVRGPEFAGDVFTAIARTREQIVTDLIPQLRLEIHLLELYEGLGDWLERHRVPYVVFNDHLPHDRLAKGRHPPRLTGQALKAGRSPERHFELLMALHARKDDVPAALDALCSRLRTQGIRMGSHDDTTARMRAVWHDRGVGIAEFPETVAAAEAARDAGDFVILGAPNAVRGGSHKGNASATDLIAMGLCDALASDYHYPSPRRAALALKAAGVLSFPGAWALVSSGPAKVLGLDDRGTLEAGKRADIVILEDGSGRVAATLAGGRFSYLNGDIAQRFLG